VGLMSHCRIEMSDDLGLGVKSVLLERNGARSGVDAEVCHKTLDTAPRR